jgi:Predicted GTPase
MGVLGIFGPPNPGKFFFLGPVNKPPPKNGNFNFKILTPNFGGANLGHKGVPLPYSPGLNGGGPPRGWVWGFKFLKHLKRCKKDFTFNWIFRGVIMEKPLYTQVKISF